MRVFVTVGNGLAPFDRLLRMVDAALPADGVEGTCQYGVSTDPPRGLRAVSSLPRAEFEAELAAADIVVCHAGVGTLWSAIEAGHCPIVVPRRARHGEIVNDHQLEICAELEKEGLINIVSATEDLAAAIKSTTRRPTFRPTRSDVDSPVRRGLEELRQHSGRRRPWLLRALALVAPPIERLRVR